VKYFQQNYVFLKAWAFFKWGHYVQKNNPNSFAVIQKISPTFKRVSLSSQRDFWKTVLDEESIRCPYSKELLSPDNFDLDHFLPRRYIAHDQFWNLIPSNPSLNREKNDRIPDREFIEPFIELQSLAINKYRNLIPNAKNEISNYLIELSIDTEEQLNKMEHFLTEINQKVIQIESFYLESPSFRLALDNQITNFMIPKLMTILEHYKLMMQMSNMQLRNTI
jgi:hypothetical protein